MHFVPGRNFWWSNQPAARPRGEGKAEISFWDVDILYNDDDAGDDDNDHHDDELPGRHVCTVDSGSGSRAAALVNRSLWWTLVDTGGHWGTQGDTGGHWWTLGDTGGH